MDRILESIQFTFLSLMWFRSSIMFFLFFFQQTCCSLFASYNNNYIERKLHRVALEFSILIFYFLLIQKLSVSLSFPTEWASIISSWWISFIFHIFPIKSIGIMFCEMFKVYYVNVDYIVVRLPCILLVSSLIAQCKVFIYIYIYVCGWWIMDVNVHINFIYLYFPFLFFLFMYVYNFDSVGWFIY